MKHLLTLLLILVSFITNAQTQAMLIMRAEIKKDSTLRARQAQTFAREEAVRDAEMKLDLQLDSMYSAAINAGREEDVLHEMQKQTRLLEQMQSYQKRQAVTNSYNKAMEDLIKPRVIPYSNQVKN